MEAFRGVVSAAGALQVPRWEPALGFSLTAAAEVGGARQFTVGDCGAAALRVFTVAATVGDAALRRLVGAVPVEMGGTCLAAVPLDKMPLAVRDAVAFVLSAQADLP